MFTVNGDIGELDGELDEIGLFTVNEFVALRRSHPLGP